MDFPVFLNKFILTNKFLRYTPFYYWFRLINHSDFRLDDRYVYQDFWNSINEGQTQMVEDAKWLEYFGAKPETVYVSQEAYDELVRRINEPPEYNENLAKLLQKKSPWDTP